MKECRTCEACGRLYRKGRYRFFRDHGYYCTKYEMRTDLRAGCAAWKKKTYEAVGVQRLQETERDLHAIARLLP